MPGSMPLQRVKSGLLFASRANIRHLKTPFRGTALKHTSNAVASSVIHVTDCNLRIHPLVSGSICHYKSHRFVHQPPANQSRLNPVQWEPINPV